MYALIYNKALSINIISILFCQIKSKAVHELVWDFVQHQGIHNDHTKHNINNNETLLLYSVFILLT